MYGVQIQGRGGGFMFYNNSTSPPPQGEGEGDQVGFVIFCLYFCLAYIRLGKKVCVYERREVTSFLLLSPFRAVSTFEGETA